MFQHFFKILNFTRVLYFYKIECFNLKLLEGQTTFDLNSDLDLYLNNKEKN